MAKRLSAYLSDWCSRKIEEWAKLEGRSQSSLVAYIIEAAVREQIDRGKLKDD